MSSTVSKLEEEWNGPQREALCTYHLVEEVDHVQRKLENEKGTWAQYGCSIVSDGWSCAKK